MVARTTLTPSGLEVSRLGLGLSHVHHLRTMGERVRLINGARDLGVTHFDTARLYGDGLSERALGRAVRGSRDQVTITTKFGLLPRDWMGAMGYGAAPLWALRGAARRSGLRSGLRADYSTGTLSTQLSTSLRLLGTGHVDCLAVHEPAGATAGQLDDLAEALARVRDSGKVRFVGLAGRGSQEIATRYPTVYDVVQVPETGWSDTPRPPDFTYEIVSAHPGQPVEAVGAAAARRPQGAVLLGTTNLEHLGDAARAVET